MRFISICLAVKAHWKAFNL